MNKLPKVNIGVDVSKNHLDFYIHLFGEEFRIKNNIQEIMKLKNIYPNIILLIKLSVKHPEDMNAS